HTAQNKKDDGLKILLTVHQFVPDFAAGTEILTFHVARELQKRGHEVRVVTGFQATRPLRDEERFDRYVHEGITVERFHHQYLVPMGQQKNIIEMEYDN